MAVKHSLYIVIIGCGRLGSVLANRFSREGHSIVVVDIDSNAFNALSPDQYSGFNIEGDATELSILKQAKTDKADILIGAAHDENINIMVAQVARKHFQVPRVIARIFDPNKEYFCDKLGIECVCPTSLTVEKTLMTLMNDTNSEKS